MICIGGAEEREQDSTSLMRLHTYFVYVAATQALSAISKVRRMRLFTCLLLIDVLQVADR